MVSKYHPTLLAACCLGILGLFAGCYQVSVSFEPSGTEVASTSPVDIPSKTVSTSQTSELLSYNSVKTNKNIGVGTLRLSNQTNQPVRLALLSRSKQAKPAAHWDFAPQEGSEKGLLLSLPDGKLQLSKGDVVVAFAQDGSRRYWGPYIVGETPFPMWNSQQKEWWLILGNG
ncbi:hypothetical protein NIES2101_37965 [Calothrix sp. HK-06]|nr:hypothetical protein NIES2101_37965 [Calothrix sp. HK-06]